MKKAIKLVDKDYVKYVYRVADITLNKVRLEKHEVIPVLNFDKEPVAVISDSKDNYTIVGTLILKVSSKVIDDLSLKVDKILTNIIIEKSELNYYDSIGITEISKVDF